MDGGRGEGDGAVAMSLLPFGLCDYRVLILYLILFVLMSRNLLCHKKEYFPVRVYLQDF